MRINPTVIGDDITIKKTISQILCMIFLIAGNTSSAQYLAFDPSQKKQEYIYKNVGHPQFLIQWKLSQMITYDPNSFIEVFDFFKEHLDINFRDLNGFNYLFTATAKERWIIVEYLVTNGIVVDFQNNFSQHKVTPLMLAAYCGHVESVRSMLEKGHADPTIKDSEGDTALDAAHVGEQEKQCKNQGNYQVVKKLLQDAIIKHQTILASY